MSYLAQLIVLFGIYAVAVVSLDLLVTHMGLISLSHLSLMLVGSYVYAALRLDLHVGSGVALLAVIGIGTAAGWTLGIVTRGLRGHRFVLATFAVHLLIVSLAQAATSITGGPAGRVRIPPIIEGGGQFSGACISALAALLIGVLVAKIALSPLGRLAHVFRENQALLRITGFDPEAVRLRACVVAGIGAALAGALYAAHVHYIDPLTFSLRDSVLLVAAIVIGGMGSPIGNALGVLCLVLLPESLRSLGLPSSVAAEVRQILFSGALLLAILYRPKGFFGDPALARRVLLR